MLSSIAEQTFRNKIRVYTGWWRYHPNIPLFFAKEICFSSRICLLQDLIQLLRIELFSRRDLERRDIEVKIRLEFSMEIAFNSR